MSVYKPKGRDTYSFDFRFRGARFRGTTGATAKREALAIEKRERERVRRQAAREATARAAFRGDAPLTLGAAAARWWHEVGRHHVNSETTWADLERLVAWFGEDCRMDDVADSDVAALVAARRGETIKGRKTLKDGSPAPLVKPSTVNRSTLDPLRRLFGHARRAWKLRLDSEPDWRIHRLPEPGEQPAELRLADQARIVADLGEGYRDAVLFALASGLRLENCLLRWGQVDWEGGRIHVVQKGGRAHSVPISREMRAILSACRGQDAEWVFTFPLARRAAGRRVLGVRYPVTYYGLQIRWRRRAKALGIGLTFHGLRHTAGTRVTRQTGNLKLAQKLLGHASVTTTAAFYAHATEEDLRAALDATPLANPHPPASQSEKRRKNR